MNEKLNKLTIELDEARALSLQAQGKLKQANDHAKAIEAQLILEMGPATTLEFDNGLSINRRESYRVSIPTLSGIERTRDPDKQMEKIGRRNDSLAFLKANGCAGAIDTAYMVESKHLNPAQIEQVKALPNTYAESIHNARLKRSVLDLMADGVDIPDCIYVEQVSKVSVSRSQELDGLLK